jgi:diketogulonate reductase-like aldo/keto reductase
VIPVIGFGTAPLDDAQTELAVADALSAGYRLIDTAAAYGNEAGVGRAVLSSDVPREEIYVITKLRGQDHTRALSSFEESRRRLGLEYVDCYLIHWPLPSLGAYVEAWKALLQLRDDGLVRSIGVSNFLPEHIARLYQETAVVPALNQVELHPGFPQDELRAFHAKHGIQTVAYSPLGRGPAGLGADLLGSESIAAVAAAHGVTPAQVVLRWHIQLGSVPLVRTSNPQRRRQNLKVFDFELTAAELDQIRDGLPRARVGFDPATHVEL